MIFLTTGTQLHFDRLVRAMDRIASNLGEEVFAQIGFGSYKPSHMNWSETVKPQQFEEMCRNANCIVSHAGIGTILTARRLGKPLIVFPRRAEFGEHRNDHQVATVKHLSHLQGVYVAEDEATLETLVRNQDSHPLGYSEVPPSRVTLINYIRSQICA